MLATSNWQQQISAQKVVKHIDKPRDMESDRAKNLENDGHGPKRKKVVVVGLGMVGIAFM